MFMKLSDFSFFETLAQLAGIQIGRPAYTLAGNIHLYGNCSSSYYCSGGGGKCGSAYDCSGGGGKCGSAYDCSGGGGKCGSAYNCSGGGGRCGSSYSCSGSWF